MSDVSVESYLLDRDEVVGQYGIPKRYLESAAAREEGPPLVRIGRLVRYRRADIERWIEKQVVFPSINQSKGG